MTPDEFLAQWHDSSATMEVRTSGSTGAPKCIRVEKSRMTASARMTCDFLGLRRGDTALLCMPVDYIAGKMMVVRATERGLHLFCVEPGGHPLCRTNMDAIGNPPVINLAAMVPLQVWNTMQVPEERATLCRTVRHLIIGGGAIPTELEKELAPLPLNVWSSYGMTETLSHIALRRIPDTFYTPLPGIKLEHNSDGCLVVNAPALCPHTLTTNDIVQFHQDNIRFRILGRRDNTVCSGGIKIQIEEVEAWLQSLGMHDVTVTCRPDARLGQAIVYLTTADIDLSALRLPAERPDSRYWLPRHIIKVDALPMTGTGKPDRAAARELALLQTAPSVSRP